MKRTYLESRIYDELELTKEFLTVSLDTNPDYHSENYASNRKNTPIITDDDEGNLEIYPYTLDGSLVVYETEAKNFKPRIYKIIRHSTFNALPTDKNGKEIKYRFPKGKNADTHPMIPPSLYKKYKDKETIKTLFLTEGYIKAIKANFHGLDIVGLSSISHYKSNSNVDKPRIYYAIQKIIEVCRVEHVVIIHDADVFKMDYKNPDQYNDEKEGDMSRRLFGFFNAAWKIKKLINDQYPKLKVWYSHINTKYKDKAKGIDDLLVMKKRTEQTIVNDALKFSDKQDYFTTTPINNYGDLKEWFALDNAQAFYKRNKEVIGDMTFIFNGDKYQPKKGKVKRVMINAAYNYFVVGDSFYKYVNKPVHETDIDGFSQIRYIRDIQPIKQGMIKLLHDDKDKHILKTIAQNNYYSGFYNLPSHQNYQNSIGDFYNLYKEVTHRPLPFSYKEDQEYREIDEIKYSIKFLEHLFGKHQKKVEGDPIEMALDYMTILWMYPRQKLPILSFVSRENKSGKSTFGVWLTKIFEQNAQFIPSENLTKNFNANWIPCLLTLFDEALIEKQIAIEKIKFLSTANEAYIEQKYGHAQNVEIHMKLVLFSNNVSNFIKIDDEETRFWIKKVSKLKKEDQDPDFVSKLVQEIPHFLFFLEKRKIFHKKKDRMWFDEELLITDELLKIKNESKSWTEQDLQDSISWIFSKLMYKTIYIELTTLTDIVKIRARDQSINTAKIRNVLQNKWNIQTQRLRRNAVDTIFTEDKGKDIDKLTLGEKKQGRFYEFNAKDFCDDELLKEISKSPFYQEGTQLKLD